MGRPKLTDAQRAESRAKRLAYQRAWDGANRPRKEYGGPITSESMRREHDLAAKILSSERF